MILRSLAAAPLVALFAVLSPAAFAQQGVKCPDGKPADASSRAGNAKGCLVMRKVEPAALKSPVLAVFLHGDSAGRLAPPDERDTAEALAQRLGVVAIALQRPGYDSALGRSDGRAGDDDYDAANLAIVAAALANLRRANPGKKLLLVGHGGGAAIAALLASRYPASADAWLLAACPCDLAGWRAARGGAAWTRSLSPLAEAGQVAPGSAIAILAGNRDDAVAPKFSEAYARALQARGVKTRVTYATNATHFSLLRSPEFFGLAQELVERAGRP